MDAGSESDVKWTATLDQTGQSCFLVASFCSFLLNLASNTMCMECSFIYQVDIEVKIAYYPWQQDKFSVLKHGKNMC